MMYLISPLQSKPRSGEAPPYRYRTPSCALASDTRESRRPEADALISTRIGLGACAPSVAGASTAAVTSTQARRTSRLKTLRFGRRWLMGFRLSTASETALAAEAAGVRKLRQSSSTDCDRPHKAAGA